MDSFTSRERLFNAILTTIQYITLIMFIVMTPKLAVGVVWLGIEGGGVILALWAIVVMQQERRVSIAPLPRSGAHLVEKGPYKVIRHPMYSSIVMTFVPLIITHFDWFRLGVLVVLFVNLLFKLRFEERVLEHYFEGYKEYAKRTKRIIPFVY